MKDYYNYIDAYLRKRLDADQQVDFERAMDKDQDLKEAVEHYRKIEPIVDIMIENDIRDKMQEIRQSKRKRSQVRMWLRVAAAVILLGLVATWIFVDTTPGAEQLFIEFYQPPINMTSRGSEQTIQLTPQEKALENAHQLIQEDNTGEAERILESLISLNSNQKEQAEWLLVMTALQAGNKELAKNRLDLILQNSSHAYNNEKAKKLLRKL